MRKLRPRKITWLPRWHSYSVEYRLQSSSSGPSCYLALWNDSKAQRRPQVALASEWQRKVRPPEDPPSSSPASWARVVPHPWVQNQENKGEQRPEAERYTTWQGAAWPVSTRPSGAQLWSNHRQRIKVAIFFFNSTWHSPLWSHLEWRKNTLPGHPDLREPAKGNTVRTPNKYQNRNHSPGISTDGTGENAEPSL